MTWWAMPLSVAPRCWPRGPTTAPRRMRHWPPKWPTTGPCSSSVRLTTSTSSSLTSHSPPRSGAALSRCWWQPGSTWRCWPDGGGTARPECPVVAPGPPSCDLERGLGTSGHTEFGDQRGDPLAYHVLRQCRLAGDLPVRLSDGNEPQHPPLLRAQGAEPVVGVQRIGDAVDEQGHQSGVQERTAPGNLLHVSHQVPAPELLEHVAGRSGHDAGVESLVV